MIVSPMCFPGIPYNSRNVLVVALNLDVSGQGGTDDMLRIAVRVASVTTEVAPSLILARNRRAGPTEARKIVYMLLAEHVGLGVAAIGILLQRDHSTVIHGLRSLRDLVDTDPQTAAAVQRARDIFQARTGLAQKEQSQSPEA